MFKSSVEFLREVRATPGKPRSNEKEEGIVFATDHATKRPSRVTGPTKNTVPFVRVRIGAVAAEKAGIKAGDKVELKWDSERRLGVISHHPEGWVLTGLQRRKPGEPEFEGFQPLQLRYTWHRGLPSIYEPKLCREVVIIKGDLGDNHIQFVFPEGTSFDKMAKPPKDEEEPANNVVQYNRRATDKQTSQAAAR